MEDLTSRVHRQRLFIALEELVERLPVLGAAGLAVEAAVVQAAAAEVVIPAVDGLRDDVVQKLDDVEERVVVPAAGMLCVRPDVLPADDSQEPGWDVGPHPAGNLAVVHAVVAERLLEVVALCELVERAQDELLERIQRESPGAWRASLTLRPVLTLRHEESWPEASVIRGHRPRLLARDLCGMDASDEVWMSESSCKQGT